MKEIYHVKIDCSDYEAKDLRYVDEYFESLDDAKAIVKEFANMVKTMWQVPATKTDEWFVREDEFYGLPRYDYRSYELRKTFMAYIYKDRLFEPGCRLAAPAGRVVALAAYPDVLCTLANSIIFPSCGVSHPYAVNYPINMKTGEPVALGNRYNENVYGVEDVDLLKKYREFKKVIMCK